MKDIVFKCTALTKKYKTGFALNKFNMEIKKGEIYGFVGANGAGKTTLMRLIAGISMPTSGEMSLFGSDNNENYLKAKNQMGFLIESPALYPEFSAYENLEVRRIQCGIPDKSAVERVLKLVGLDFTNKKTKVFSKGMTQRLGIAIAIIAEPEFLILDEPTNGLDATGIIEIRELLLKLNREKNTTILISSHILNELYHMATYYGFIHKGEMLQEISFNDLNDRCKKHILINVDDVRTAVSIIESELKTDNYEVYPDNKIRLYDYLDESYRVSEILIKNNIKLNEIALRGDELENYYLNLIRGK